MHTQEAGKGQGKVGRRQVCTQVDTPVYEYTLHMAQHTFEVQPRGPWKPNKSAIRLHVCCVVTVRKSFDSMYIQEHNSPSLTMLSVISSYPGSKKTCSTEIFRNMQFIYFEWPDDEISCPVVASHKGCDLPVAGVVIMLLCCLTIGYLTTTLVIKSAT